MKHLNLFVSVVLLSLNISVAAEETKDIGIGNDAVLLGINTENNTVMRATNSAPLKVDVNLLYMYSDARGTGKAHPLDNGSTLFSGDKFTIALTANEDTYLYLYHFDSHGNLNELLTMSGYSNELKAGQKLILPAPDKHFSLDDKVGTETIHTIASKVGMADLTEKYKAKVLSNAMLADAVTKGILITKDILIGADNVNTVSANSAIITAPRTSESTPSTEGRVIGCQAVESACRESFVIKHLAR